VVSTVDQFAAGVTEVRALAKGGRQDAIQVRSISRYSHWSNSGGPSRSYQALAAGPAPIRVVLWILRHDLKSILSEIEGTGAQRVLS